MLFHILIVEYYGNRLLFTFKPHRSNTPEKKIGCMSNFKCRKPHPTLKMKPDKLFEVFLICTTPLVYKYPDTCLVRQFKGIMKITSSSKNKNTIGSHLYRQTPNNNFWYLVTCAGSKAHQYLK
jgi:hypothetical protein